MNECFHCLEIIYSILNLSLVNTVNFITFGYELFVYQRLKHQNLIVKLIIILSQLMFTAKFTFRSVNLL